MPVFSLEAGKKLHDFRRGPVGSTNKLPADHSLTVNDVSFGPAEGPIKIGGFAVGITHGDEVNAVFLDKAVVSIAVFIDANGEDGHSLVLQTLLHGDQGRCLLHARWAP